MLAMAMSVSPLLAQSTVQQSKSAVSPGPGPAPAPTALPSLQSLENAVRTQDYTAVQLRRFRDERGGFVTVQERLEVDANGTERPDYRITFLSVVGELPGSRVTVKWQRHYLQHSSEFFSHGTFRVRNLSAAVTNYSIHDFGAVTRAGRSARRTVVFPNTVDKAIWLIDVDTQTHVPLYAAEYDVQLRLLAEVEAQSFLGSVVPWVTSLAGSTPFASFVAARTSMGQPAGLVDPNLLVASEYQTEAIHVRVDPLNGRSTLTMSFTDGVDQFMVVQTPNTSDVFQGLPSSAPGTSTIGRFRDPAMSALLFWEGGVSFHVAGRGSLLRLDDLAESVLRQALSSN